MQKTEMMKRYETETGKDRPTVNIYSLIDWYEAFSAWLESQLTWRPVSEELPSVEKDGDAIMASHKDVDKGLVSFDCVSTMWFLNNYKIWFTHWLPIPPAPEEKNE